MKNKSNSCIAYSSFHLLISALLGGDMLNQLIEQQWFWDTSFWSLYHKFPPFSIFQHNARGILSMANSGPNTNGSQFFISYAKQPHLNGLYTIFGKVIHGFEVLDLMEKVHYCASVQIIPFCRLVGSKLFWAFGKRLLMKFLRFDWTSSY